MVTTAEVVRLLLADGLPKADALATARIAGIAGAKRTSDLIPLCHPLPIDAVTVDLRPQGDTVLIEARVSTTGRTGVEMEALTAVTVAGLTLHDMVKAVDPGATMTDVQLVEKTGGKHGRWTRDQVPARAGGGRARRRTGAGRLDRRGGRVARGHDRRPHRRRGCGSRASRRPTRRSSRTRRSRPGCAPRCRRRRRC